MVEDGDEHAMRRWRRRRLASARAVRIVGICLGVVITAGLAVLVALDREARLTAAHRQSSAMATGVDRLLQLELRNVERALRGILADAQDHADLPADEARQRRARSVQGVVERHVEIAGIDVFEAPSAPGATGGPPRWLTDADPAPGTLIAGPLESRGGEWRLLLGVVTGDGSAVIARVRTREFEAMVAGLDVGLDGSATIFNADGVVLARYGRTGTHVGRRIEFPPALGSQGRFTGPLVSALDRVERMVSFSATSGYPVVVGTGLGLREAMRPWWILASCAMALSALYWLVLIVVLRRLGAEERARDAMLREIGAQSEWLQQAQLASGTGVWRLEAGSGAVRVSPEMAALYGLTAEKGAVPLDDFFARMHPDDAPRVREQFAAQQVDGGPLMLEYRVLPPGAPMRWLKALGATIVRNGRAVTTGTVTDVTERRATQQRIEHAETQFRHLFERNPLPAWVYDIETLRMLAVNDAAIEAYGYARETFMTLTVTDLIPPLSRGARGASRRHGEEGGRGERLWTAVAQDGRRIEVRVHARDIVLQDRAARLMLTEDIGARLAYERDLAWRATHDATTGMLTPAALADTLDASCAVDGGRGFAIAYVRLRDLDVIAPTLGREAGEQVLREAAARYARVAEAFGHVAHAPAESFVVATLEPARLDAMVEALVDVSATPVQAAGGTFALEAWIGLASGPCDDGGADQVIAHAALAALRARRESASVMHYDGGMANEAAARLALVQRLRDAIERRAFALVYQPIYRLSDGRVAAIEALLRWPQADGSQVSPAEFIPLAEDSGLIVPLGAWVLEEAARAHRHLAGAGHADVAVAVNVSAVQFEAAITPDTIAQLRRRYALPPQALHLELTESVLLRNPEAARSTMGRLRDEGVCLSIDDFGTGFSSMAYLRELPLDQLKIDRAFVRDVATDPRSAAICRALIALGHGLGLSTIAEGVENGAQYDWLRRHGCDLAQGFHLGRPEPLDAVLDRLGRMSPPRRAAGDRSR